MKTLAVASLLSMASVLSAACVCFLVAETTTQTVGQELAATRTHAQETAQTQRIFPLSPAGDYIVSMVPPTISPADRARIDALQLEYESLIFRRDLAAWFVTRGIIVASLIAGFSCFLKKQMANRLLQPTLES